MINNQLINTTKEATMNESPYARQFDIKEKRLNTYLQKYATKNQGPIRYKGFVIVFNKETKEYAVFTKDEYSYGKGYRYPEIECSSIKEAKEFIDHY
jgi:hypothetical protein